MTQGNRATVLGFIDRKANETMRGTVRIYADWLQRMDADWAPSRFKEAKLVVAS